MTVVESLVQVTVVAGPPMEIQVRVCWSESNVTPPINVMSPKTKSGNSLVYVEQKIFIKHI